MSHLLPDSPERMLKRERLFVWLRYAALLLLGAYFILEPHSSVVPLGWSLNAVAIGFVLNSAAFLLLRARRLGPLVGLGTALADAFLILYVIFVTGGVDSPLWILVMLLIAATALRYGALGGLATAVIFAAIHVVAGLQAEPASGLLFAAAVKAVTLVTTALMLGWVMRFEQRHTWTESEQARTTLKRSLDDLKAFTELTGAISSGTNYHVTLQLMLDLCLRGLSAGSQSDDALAGMVLLFDEEDGATLVSVVQRQFAQLDERKRLSPIRGCIQTVIQTVEPLVLRDARKDPLLAEFETVARHPSVAILPLRAGMTLFGVVVFAGNETQSEVFAERLELMEAYTTLAAIAVQSARFLSQAVGERNHIIDSEEKVRHELARDLHDGPVNQVAGLAMGLDFARRLLDKEPDKAKEELDNLHKLATRTARDMRITMYRLRPLALETGGLSAGIEQYLNQLRAENMRPAFHFSALDAAGFEPLLSSNSAMMVFDIMKEAIGNTLKHADADNIWVELRASAPWLIATTTDDGKGFDLAAVQDNYSQRGSLGLINIQERAELAQGEATIDSAPGKGTTVSVRVPLSH
jgi:signal transduction histidine kinase